MHKDELTSSFEDIHQMAKIALDHQDMCVLITNVPVFEQNRPHIRFITML